MKKITAIFTALVLSIASTPRPVKANPAMLLAPELCATGVGCVVGAVIIIGGIAYVVQQRNGHKVLVPKDAGVTYSRAISGIEAAKRGDAHWSATIDGCYKIGKRIGKKPKEHPDAVGGGFWCIFPGKQTNLGDEK